MSLDECPVCEGRVKDFDDDGMELDTGQRWHISHFYKAMRIVLRYELERVLL